MLGCVGRLLAVSSLDRVLLMHAAPASACSLLVSALGRGVTVLTGVTGVLFERLVQTHSELTVCSWKGALPTGRQVGHRRVAKPSEG